jgi:hypothetical protein
MRLTEEQKASVEPRLAGGESIRSLAREFGVSYQSLQYHRRRAGAPALRAARTSGADHASWRGGSFVDRHGYRMVLAPGRGKASKYAMEHVLVAEQQQGSHLRAGEVVHHIDLDPANNGAGNLLVCTRKRHKELHHQLERIAGEMLREGLIVWNGTDYQRT